VRDALDQFARALLPGVIAFDLRQILGESKETLPLYLPSCGIRPQPLDEGSDVMGEVDFFGSPALERRCQE